MNNNYTSNVESYLDKRGILESNKKYTEAERVFKTKTKLENRKTIPQARYLLVLESEDHKPSQWKQVFNQWEGNLLTHSMEALTIIVDPNYKLIYLESTLGGRERQIYLGWREWMKKNKLEELDNFHTNITVISLIDLMKKLVLGVDEKDDVIKQIKAIRNLQQLKIYDLRLFDEYANYFYKYWSEIGRPFDEDL